MHSRIYACSVLCKTGVNLGVAKIRIRYLKIIVTQYNQFVGVLGRPNNNDMVQSVT